jgi:Protein of unknown function (DUF1524)
MTLLSPKPNEKIGDASYAEKKKVYAASGYAITQELIETYPTWSLADIDTWQKSMAHDATKI